MTKQKSSNLSPLAKVISILVMIAIPFVILILTEVGLRIFDYGGNLDLFVLEQIGGKKYYVLNKNFTRRYFFKKGIEAPSPRSQIFSAEKDSSTYRIFCLGGSSTLGTPYPPNAAFPAMLQHILSSLHPDKKFEVVNCGVTAITTHSVLDMGREILSHYQPDLLVVYSGHNEFYGVFGQASRLFLFDNQTFIQTFLKLQRFRFFRLLRNLYINIFGERIVREDVIDPGTLMGTVAREAEIPLGNDLYLKTEEHYQQNIEVLVQLAKKNQTDIILCNLVSNLRDLTPFKSLHSKIISAQATEKMDELLNEAKQLKKDNEFEKAIKILNEAMNLDPSYAEVHFLLGKCLERVGHYEHAKKQFKSAKDFDVIRFRAPSSFNRLLKQIADANNIPLINIESAFNENSPDGIVGNNLILEHIHPNNIGYFLMAKTIAKGMADAHLVNQTWDWSGLKPDSVYIAMSKLSPLSYEVVNAGMRQLTSHWPFTLRVEKRDYQQVGDELAEKLAKEFVARGGGNLIQLHLNLGTEYLAQQEFDKALTEFEAALAIEPNCEAYNQIGLYYAQKTEWAANDRDTRRALSYYQKAKSYFTDGLTFCPEHLSLLYNLGLLYTLTKMERQKGPEVFEKVLKIDPNHRGALQQLIKFYLINKNFEQAEIYLKKGIDLHPKETDFYLNLAMIYLNNRKLDQAEKVLNEILEAKPENEEVQNLLKEVHLQKSHNK